MTELWMQYGQPISPPVPSGNMPPLHPVTASYRMMDADELEGLVASIKASGLIDPIIIGVLNGERFILDGRNRLKACEAAQIEPRFKEVTFGDEDELRAFVVAGNGERLHITKGQKAMAHALLFPEPEMLKRRSDVSPPNTFSKVLLSKARSVLAWSPQMALSVRNGTTSLKDAYERVIADRERIERVRRKRQEILSNAPDIFELELGFDEAVAVYEQRKTEAVSLIERGRRAIASFATISAAVGEVRVALDLSRDWKVLPNKITGAEAGSIDLGACLSNAKIELRTQDMVLLAYRAPLIVQLFQKSDYSDRLLGACPDSIQRDMQ